MMDYTDLSKKLSMSTDSKIVMIVMDGLGGCEREQGGKTELEAARTPHLDALAAGGVTGLSDPIAPGFTPGSGPAHLSLFGYDPVKYEIGRGALAAAGIGFEHQAGDVAARGNFCTLDAGGLVTDRRAGRIPTEKCAELTPLLDGMEFDGVKVFVRPVKDYRFVIVFRGQGLGGNCADSDPQQTGRPPLEVTGADPASQKTAAVANAFIAEARRRLAGLEPANGVLTRGYDVFPDMPQMQEIYKLNPACIAVYPDYKGVSRLIGMKIHEQGQDTIAQEFDILEQTFADHDFFFVHIKKTDSYGEDGNFDGKVHVIEELDAQIPRLLALKPDVIVVTGDHSTPALLKSHSWHPLPLLIHSNYCRRDGVAEFSERACAAGGLGRIPHVSIMPLAMANALKMLKFGA